MATKKSAKGGHGPILPPKYTTGHSNQGSSGFQKSTPCTSASSHQRLSKHYVRQWECNSCTAMRVNIGMFQTRGECTAFPSQPTIFKHRYFFKCHSAFSSESICHCLFCFEDRVFQIRADSSGGFGRGGWSSVRASGGRAGDRGRFRPLLIWGGGEQGSDETIDPLNERTEGVHTRVLELGSIDNFGGVC